MTSPSNLWIVGTDEFATQTQACEGWTYFTLPKKSAIKFESEGQKILDQSRENSFHGTSCNNQNKDAYKKFLKLIRATLEQNGYTCNTLHSKRVKDSNYDFSTRIARETIHKAIKPYANKDEIEQRAVNISTFAPVLFNTIQALEPLGPDRKIQLKIDDHSSYADVTEPDNVLLPIYASPQELLRMAGNAIKKTGFPQAPSCGNNPIETMKDSRNLLIQAADVIGNFSMAYVFIELGDNSKSRKLKAQLLEDVFGDTIEQFDFSSEITLHGHDFSLNNDDTLIFQIAARYT